MKIFQKVISYRKHTLENGWTLESDVEMKLLSEI